MAKNGGVASNGAVALLVINTDRSAALSQEVPDAAERYTLTARNLLDKTVELNGSELALGADDALPQLTGIRTRAGRLTFAPASITFLAVSKANNASCRVVSYLHAGRRRNGRRLPTKPMYLRAAETPHLRAASTP